MSAAPLLLDAEAVFARCSPERAARAVEQALHDGLDPAGDIARVPVPVEHGHLLLMPSGAHDGFRTPGIDHVGVKVATVAPDNPAAGLPRIQASYLLFDAATLSLRAILDGTALTTLRTPAVSIAAVRRHLLRRDGPLAAAVIGSGPQALAHAVALEASIGPHRLCQVHFLVRDLDGVADSVPPGMPTTQLGSLAADRVLRDADVVVCATSARQPVLDGTVLADHVVVVAVGSHEPDAREVDAALCRRANVVVEDRTTALREAGDIVLAAREGAIDPTDLVSMRHFVTGGAPIPTDQPLLFKSVGMSWQDLVVATAVLTHQR
jgi:ornithine cyclodeaminase/alanine dehydrogenase-like protein (mu-crystallin family)